MGVIMHFKIKQKQYTNLVIIKKRMSFNLQSVLIDAPEYQQLILRFVIQVLYDSGRSAGHHHPAEIINVKPI